MKGKIFLCVMMGFLTFVAFAEGTMGKARPEPSPAAVREESSPEVPLSRLERVKAFKALIRDVDAKSVGQTIAEIEESREPELDLAVREAMAKTYADIVREERVTEQKQKEWLYSMVAINMAYLQFGGQQDRSENGLNRLIRRKLKEYLPPAVLEQIKAQHALE